VDSSYGHLYSEDYENAEEECARVEEELGTMEVFYSEVRICFYLCCCVAL
jgi:hypothetical protein